MMHPIAALIGRIAISILFLYSGYNKLIHPSGAIQAISSIGLPLPKVFYALTVAIEIFGGLLLFLGGKTRIAAMVLAFFLIPVTYYFHFDLTNHAQTIQLLKNVAIFGGLLGLVANGAGAVSLDRK